jgi:integrase
MNLLAKEIERKILIGQFKLQDYFAVSKKWEKQENEIKEEKVVTISEYANQWLRLMENNLAYSTLKGYKYQLRKTLPIPALRKSGVKTKTIRNAIGVLNSLFGAACKDGYLHNNPARGIIIRNLPINEMPEDFEEDVTENVFSEKEVNMILTYIKDKYPRYVLFFAIGFFSGARTGEILGLRWSDIDLIKNRIRIARTRTEKRLKLIPKSGKARYIDILPELQPYITEHKQYIFVKDKTLTEDGDLFINSKIEPYKGIDSFVRKFWSPALTALKITYRRPYYMRHTFACTMLASDDRKRRNLKWISSMLGHKDLSMLLKIYGNKITDLG